MKRVTFVLLVALPCLTFAAGDGRQFVEMPLMRGPNCGPRCSTSNRLFSRSLRHWQRASLPMPGQLPKEHRGVGHGASSHGSGQCPSRPLHAARNACHGPYDAPVGQRICQHRASRGCQRNAEGSGTAFRHLCRLPSHLPYSVIFSGNSNERSQESRSGLLGRA